MLNVGDLTFEQRWILFRGLVCAALIKNGYRSGDEWAFTESLDMSFEALDDIEFSEWERIIENDCQEYMRSEPWRFQK